MLLLARPGFTRPSLVVALALSVVAGCKGRENLRSQTPQIEVTPATLTVQPLPVGKSSLSILQVRNSGNADLHFKSAPLAFDTDNDGTDGELIVVSALEYDCSGTKRSDAVKLLLGPGECARVVVQYLPANLDRDLGEVKIESDDPDRPIVHVPVGMGDAAQLTLCAYDLDGNKLGCDGAGGGAPTVPFGQIDRGKTLKRIVRLKNEGKSPLEISGILDPGGPSAGEYTADLSKVPSKLQPGATADLTVTFAPSGAGLRKAWIEIDSGDPVRPAVQVPLQGQGDGPALCADPDPLDFGASNIGTTVEKTVKFTSCGTAPVLLKQVAFDALSDRVFTAKTALPGPRTLNIGETFDLTLLFKPDQVGATTGALLTPTPDSPNQYLTLKGIGNEAPICRLDAASLIMDFGQVVKGQFAERILTLANRGKADCHLNAATITQGSATFSVRDPITNVIPLRPGDVFTFTIRYSPPASSPTPQVDSGQATIDSDDPLRPKLDVKLSGEAAGAPVCKLQVTPQPGGFFPVRTLQFGNVTVGKSKILPVTFKNVGSAACTLSGTRFVTNDLSQSCSAGSCQGFTVVPPLVTTPIQPGQSSQINVSFIPKDTNQPPALFPSVYLNAVTSDKSIPTECTQGFPPNGTDGCIAVGMSGQGVVSNLAVIPADLDFGTVTLGCHSRTENVTLYNTGTATFTIKSLKIDGPNVADFYLVAPPTPFTMVGGAKLVIQVTFKPSQVGKEAATLYIESDASNTTSNNPFVTVALSGTGTTDKHQKDTFTQLVKPTVDMLFVIDNSGSFQDFQDKLSQQAPRFINRALSFNADYHISVSTNEADHTDTADSYSSYPGDKIYVGGLFGHPAIIESSTANAATAFSKNIKVGTCCSSSRESGLEASWKALSAPAVTTDPPVGSKGFLRDEARLVVVNVSDEVDQSHGGTDFYVDFFQSLKGRYNAGLVSFNSIMGDPGTGCDLPNGGGHVVAGDRYNDVVKRTGGKWWSICTADWATVADDLSLDAFKGRIQFPLTRPVDPMTLSVTMNAAPQNQPADYRFDQPSNSIVFTLSPPAGATIVAEYDALCL